MTREGAEEAVDDVTSGAQVAGIETRFDASQHASGACDSAARGGDRQRVVGDDRCPVR